MKQFFTTFFFLFLIDSAFASPYGNLRYQVELEMNDGRKITGYIFTGILEYPDTLIYEFPGDSFTQYVKAKSTLVVYLKIHKFTLIYSMRSDSRFSESEEKDTTKWDQTFEAVIPNETLQISTSTIKTAKMIDYSQAEIYPENGLYGPLSPNEIIKLTTIKPKSNYLHEFYCYTSGWYFQMVSFNPAINEEKLKSYLKKFDNLKLTEIDLENADLLISQIEDAKVILEKRDKFWKDLNVNLTSLFTRTKNALQKENVICFWWYWEH